ncbi:MAG TPA: L-lactate dehydrogenase [Thermotogota bacterium]|nr:L-lactate dehydrogenase [Thermotogota bacterium]
MKVSMIGAGRVGSATVFALVQKGLASEVTIIDNNEALAQGEALDIAHSTPFSRRTIVKGGGYDLLDGANIVIVSAGAAQKPGENRLNLVRRNAQIVRDIATQIRNRAPGAIVLVVTNPVDVLTTVMLHATGFESTRVLGSGTVLDTARLRSLIAANCGISASSVHVYVIGEHGDSEVAAWSRAMIGGIGIQSFSESCPAKQRCQPGCDQKLHAFFEQTRNAAYEIISRKGATNYAIAAATCSIVESIVHDEKRVLTVSVPLRDVHAGYPAVIGKDGVERQVPISLSEEEKKAFEQSLEIIRKTLQAFNPPAGEEPAPKRA